MMAPSTDFTKIWRMRNSGSVSWPQGARLVWIGGDKFCHEVSAELEIPANGLAVDGVLDVAVDFTSPELPGRYISYWRMASPSGTKFGQRVWVLIQVHSSKKESNSNEGLDVNFPINNSLLVGEGASTSSPPETSSRVSYPIVDLTQALGQMVEESLLQELEQMGFKQVDLNKEVLRLNEYNLEQSVDDLCGVSEWDQILEELQERGFCDENKNKTLLKKNNGSIRRVVMDLLSGEKA